jgi:hypothetical protein
MLKRSAQQQFALAGAERNARIVHVKLVASLVVNDKAFTLFSKTRTYQ